MEKIYIVEELVILTDNQFDIYTTTHIATKDKNKATAKFEEVLATAVSDFNNAEVVVESEYNKYVQRADNYDRIEVALKEMDLK